MMQENIEVKAILPEELNNMPGYPGNLFYHPGWLELLRKQYGFKYWKTCGPADEYILFAQVKGVVGDKLISLPFSDYTFPRVAPERVPLHIASLQRYFPGLPILIKFSENYASPHDLRLLGEPVQKAYLHRVLIDEHTYERMSATFRRGIRKASKSGITTNLSRSEKSLQQFYELYFRLRTEKLGLIPQPLSFFKLVYEQFICNNGGFFYEVLYDEKVIASAIILRDGDTLYYKWGCSSLEYLYFRPNNLLFHELLQLASEINCRYLDLGLSDLDEKRGLIRFKKNMGGDPSFIYTYCQYPEQYPTILEKQMKIKLNQMADMVVQLKLPQTQMQAFSQSLYPLFV